VATSSPVSDAQLDRLIAYVEGRGYPVRLADGILDRSGYLAGTREPRAAGVMPMFADPDVALVLPADGGMGADHPVDRLDYALIAGRHPGRDRCPGHRGTAPAPAAAAIHAWVLEEPRSRVDEAVLAPRSLP